MKLFRLRHGIPRAYLVYAIFCIVLLYVIRISFFETTTRAFYDTLRTQTIDHDAVIVAIDDETLTSYGGWPLRRDLYASLLSEIAHYEPDAVLIDILFLEPKEGDSAVENILNKLPFPVIFGVKQDGSLVRESVFASSSQSGYVNVMPDSDGKVRRMMGSLYSNGTRYQPLSLAKYTNPSMFKEGAHMLYPLQVPEVSFKDILMGDIPKEILKDKTLFVGVTTLDLGDYFVGMNGDKVPGVYVHAAMYASYTEGTMTQEVNTTIFLLGGLCIFFFGVALVQYYKKIYSHILVLGGLTGGLLVLAVVVFDVFLYEIPIASYITLLYGGYGGALLVTFTTTRKEHARIRSTFSKYVNKEVLEHLLTTKEVTLSGEKRHLSILFSDLRGFTTFSETHTGEEVTELLNAYFDSMVQAIFTQKGTVDKFIGDAVMAFWNAPTLVHHHEYKSLLAAIAMQEALRDFNLREGTDLRMGIGIHSGQCIVGSLGGKERLSYTALGNAVNTASRVEGATKYYGADILITEDIYEACKGHPLPEGWRIRKVDHVILKGKQEALVLYEVTQIQEEHIVLYEQAFVLYKDKNMEEAKNILIPLSEKGDMAATFLLKRIEEVKDNPYFTGVYRFTDK